MHDTLIRLAVLLAVCLSVGCSSVRKPEVRAVNVQIAGIDFSGLGVMFLVDVDNPYPVALRTPRFRYGIDVAGTEFMRSEALTAIDLPAGGVGTVPLPVRMEYADLWAASTRLKDASEVAYRLHGAIVVSTLDRSWDLPLEHRGTLPILRPPTFSAPRVRIGDVSLNRAQVVLDVDVHNPNVCGLGLTNLGYNLALGGVQVGSLRASTPGELAAKSTGNLSLSGEITAAAALLQLVRGESLGAASLTCSGSIDTPFGSVPLRPGLVEIRP